MSSLFESGHTIINVGLRSFAQTLEFAGAHAVHVDWQPPAGSDPRLAMQLASLINHPRVEAANRRAYAAYLQARPVLTGVARASEVIPGFSGRMLLHAGPPIAFENMCGPMQGALVGAILHEGWAQDAGAAANLAASGKIGFATCHELQAVGPMAGVISPSMSVWIVEDAVSGNRAFSNFNEGLGKVLRFGAHYREVLERLRWMDDVLMPVLQAILAQHGPLELKPLIAQALHMGDECHNRNVAASSLFLRKLVPAALATSVAQTQLGAALSFIAGNDHFFLNLSMAACKAMLDAAHGVPGSSLVTAMARNGVQFGIRLSGTGEAWFEAPAMPVTGLYFPGYGPHDAAPDLGDSAITEAAGLGGFAMAASPAIVQFVGGTPGEAVANTRAMTHITLGRNSAFTLPALNFGGTPAGIDARKVLDSGIAPIINTGIAHRQAGIGQIGAGITHAPLECFAQAIAALSAQGGDSDYARDI
jgi:hypothetical protein